MNKSFFKNIITFLFIGIIFCSCYVILFGDFGYDLHLLKLERKKPEMESFPHIKRIKNAPEKIDSYLDYHFPFKKLYLKFGNSILYYFLNISATDRVLVGKDNWLFNGDEYIDIAKGKLFSDEQLKSLTRFLLKRKKFFNDSNIEYIVVFATDKETVYPEKYSSKYQPLAKYTRYDQLYNYLKNNTSLEIVYPKKHVRKSCKESELPCYFELDSHWNDIGAFYAYQKIYDVLLKKYPSIKAPTLNDFNIKYEVGSKGFINVLGVYESKKVNIPSPFLVYKDSEKFSYLDDIRTSVELEAKSTVNVTKFTNLDPKAKGLIPRIVLWGDSFSVRLTKYLAYNTKEIINVRHVDKTFNLDSIKKYKPTIVIDEFLTRKISKIRPALHKKYL